MYSKSISTKFCPLHALTVLVSVVFTLVACSISDADDMVLFEQAKTEPDSRQAIDLWSKYIERFPADRNARIYRSEHYNLILNHHQALDDLDYFGRPACYSCLLHWLYNRGVAYRGMQEYQRAIDSLTELIGKGTEQSLAYEARGTVYLEVGSYESAIEDLRKALRTPDAAQLTGSDRSRILELRGRTYFFLKQYQTSLDTFQEAMKADGSAARPYLSRASLLLSTGLREDALRDVEIDIDRSEVLDSQSQVLAIIGHFCSEDLASGKKLMERVLRKSRNGTWPYPLIRFLAGESTAIDAHNSAKNPYEVTDAQACIGMRFAQLGRTDDATKHLKWTFDNGRRDRPMYWVALANRTDGAREKPSISLKVPTIAKRQYRSAINARNVWVEK